MYLKSRIEEFLQLW